MYPSIQYASNEINRIISVESSIDWYPSKNYPSNHPLIDTKWIVSVDWYPSIQIHRTISIESYIRHTFDPIRQFPSIQLFFSIHFRSLRLHSSKYMIPLTVARISLLHEHTRNNTVKRRGKRRQIFYYLHISTWSHGTRDVTLKRSLSANRNVRYNRNFSLSDSQSVGSL